MTIHLFNQTNHNIKSYEETLIHVFNVIDTHQEINIIIVDSKQMTNYNLQFRQKDSTTDVLTFPSDDEDMETIGDIFINYDKIIEQATSYGHSEAREVAFLAVHGYLHILGYDHHNEGDEARMIQKQNEILNRAGLERK